MTIMRLIKHLFAENLTTKAMALLMAAALWTYAYFSSLQEIKQDLPLAISPPPGWAVIEQEPVSLSATLECPKYSAQDVREALNRGLVRVAYRVESEPASPLRSFSGVSLAAGNFLLPAGKGARVRSWQPETISFTIAKEDTRKLPVKLELSPPPPGYALQGPPWYAPREVTVRGPVAALDKVESVSTDEIRIVPPPRNVAPPRAVVGVRPYIEAEVEGRKRNFSITCNEKVEYIVYLTELSQPVVFDNVRIQILRPAGYSHQVKLKQPEMRVTVRGPEKEVAALKAENIVLFVDVGKLEPGPTPYPQPVLWQIIGFANPASLKVELEQEQVGVDVSAAG